MQAIGRVRAREGQPGKRQARDDAIQDVSSSFQIGLATLGRPMRAVNRGYT